MKTKILFVSVVALAATLLAACGGGGGGGSSTPTPPLTPTPVAKTLSISSASSNGEGLVSGTLTTTGDVTGITGSASYSCPSGSVAGTVSVTGSTFTVTPMSTLPASATCTVPVTLTATGVTPATTQVTVTTPAPWYKAVQIIPLGVRQNGVNQLPIGCTSRDQPCWRESVLSGLAKTGGPGTVIRGRPTSTIVFKNRLVANGVDGQYQIASVYTDDFSPADSGGLASGISLEIDWFVFTPSGVVAHFKSLNECFEWSYVLAEDTFKYKAVVCPP